MNNEFKESDIKNSTNYFFYDKITIKNLDENKNKMMKSHTKIFLFIKLDE